MTTLVTRIPEREMFQYAEPESAVAAARSRIDTAAAEQGLGKFQHEEISHEMLFQCYALYRTYAIAS